MFLKEKSKRIFFKTGSVAGFFILNSEYVIIINMTNTPILVKKADGTLEVFNQDKLKQSLRNAGTSEPVIDSIVGHIIDELEDGMSTKQIYGHAFSLLKRIENPVSFKYSLRKAIADLGPTGFPFEKFVAEICKAKGYETLTDQIVRGECVEHEIDVVAWNDRKLIMSEAKFHNELGLKSDLKVALYITARFEDIKNATFNYGGIERKLTEGILVTNTKFTEVAMKYAECRGLRLIGWNFPRFGNLQDMIEDAGLHPITSLLSLSIQEKTKLIGEGIVLCQTIANNYNCIKSLNLTKDREMDVIDEVKTLCPVPLGRIEI